jgi:FixJ family two-component response regulator
MRDTAVMLLRRPRKVAGGAECQKRVAIRQDRKRPLPYRRAAMKTTDSQQRHRPLIAVVDDDEFICRAISRLVLSFGVRAATFAYSGDFVELLESDPDFKPVCVVLDLHMPGLDGLAVQKELSTLRPGVPVIFLTGRVERHEVARALSAGALAVFHKPLHDDMEAFVDAVAAAVQAARKPD